MKSNLFKKLSALALCLMLILSLAACGKKKTNNPDNNIAQNIQNNNEQAIINSNNSSSQNKEENKSEGTLTDNSSASNSGTQKPSSNPSKPTPSKPSEKAKLSKTEAKEIVLKDAKLKYDEVYDFEIELDYKKDLLVYDVSFEKNGIDYHYKVDAKTGKILSYEKPKTSITNGKISSEKAKSIALTHAGLKADQISQFHIEFEKDDGILEYEVSFKVGKIKYNYTINAENGKIIESEKDKND